MERALISYLLGASLGSIALVIERLALGVPLSVVSLAAYSAVGGSAAALTRSLAELRSPGYSGRASCLAVLAAFGTLHLSYFANVKVLPTEPFWTLRSLAADIAILLPLLAGSWGLLRSSRAQELRLRWGHVASVGGLLAMVLGTTVLAREWPRASAEAQRRGEGPNLLLVVMDSARRDRMGLYGHARPTSPSLDQWARQARVYDRAYAASSWTVPSVATLLQRQPEFEPLSARLARRGYATACFTDNPHLGAGSPLLTGFDHVEGSVGQWRRVLSGTILGETVERLAPGDDADLADRAIDWGKRQSGPVFLYVHLMDSHTPYRHDPIDARRRGGRHIEFPATGMATTAEEAEDIVARYEGGIRSADRAAGRLLEALGHFGRPWLAIVTSDHGESLGESGRWFHGGSLAQELLDVPLLVLGTEVEAGRMDGIVGHAAVPFTLATAAGLPCTGCGEKSDLRRSSGGVSAVGGLPSHLRYRIAGDYKVVLDAERGQASLFNLATDPGELHDLASSEQGRLAQLIAPLATPALVPSALEGSDLERLKALGYLTASREHSGSR